MSEQTYVPCPHCGHPYPMTPMQKELYRGRTLACNNCAKIFSADELTPLPIVAPRPLGFAVARPAPSTPPAETGAASPAAAPARRRNSWPQAAIFFGGAVVVIALVMGLLIPPLNRAREQTRRVACSSNMRQLGQAMMIYASVNGGRFPDQLDRLLAYAPAATMVCPSTSHTAAAGQTPAAQAANLAAGGHLSYVYIGAAYNSRSSVTAGTTIVLYEPLGDHGDGINALFADGHVEYLPTATATIAIPALATATPSATGPATPATLPAASPAVSGGPPTQPSTTEDPGN